MEQQGIYLLLFWNQLHLSECHFFDDHSATHSLSQFLSFESRDKTGEMRESGYKPSSAYGFRVLFLKVWPFWF